MARYELEPLDYGRIRFAISPLTEVGCSLRLLKHLASYPLQAGWYEHVRTVHDRLPLDVLSALIWPQFDTPDFLNPRAGEQPDIAKQLSHLRAQPAGLLADDIERATGSLAPVLARARRGLPRLLTCALATYWELAFRPHWQRMRAVLDADIASRGRQVVAVGMIETLNACGHGIRASGTGIDAEVLGHDSDHRLRSAGARSPSRRRCSRFVGRSRWTTRWTPCCCMPPTASAACGPTIRPWPSGRCTCSVRPVRAISGRSPLVAPRRTWPRSRRQHLGRQPGPAGHSCAGPAGHAPRGTIGHLRAHLAR